jgi:hypothetical protein
MTTHQYSIEVTKQMAREPFDKRAASLETFVVERSSLAFLLVERSNSMDKQTFLQDESAKSPMRFARKSFVVNRKQSKSI